MAEDHGFKFDIGAFVAFKTSAVEVAAAAAEFAALSDDDKKRRLLWERRPPMTPNRLMVIDRVLEECYGGIQRHYGLRMVGTDKITAVARFFEIELIPYPEPQGSSERP